MSMSNVRKRRHDIGDIFLGEIQMYVGHVGEVCNVRAQCFLPSREVGLYSSLRLESPRRGDMLPIREVF